MSLANDTLRPETPDQLQDALAWSLSEQAPLEILGQGTKRGWGRPVESRNRLDMSALTGITLYEPEELVLSARAGTPLAEIRTALAEKNQELAFEPGDWAPLWGGAAGAGTVGGMIGCNLAGPRRIRQGAARDHFLGFTAVTGRGETVKSGGRVVKNVTGYDLSKLLCGSFGTLAAMSEVTLKVLPRAEKTRTVLLLGLDDRRAIEVLCAALGSPHEVSGAAHLPKDAAAGSEVSFVKQAGGSVTAIRVEGPGPSVDARCAALRQELAGFGGTEELHSHNSLQFWRELTDLAPLAARPDLAIWRVSVKPTDGADVAAEILAERDGLHLFDWGGGLVWFGTAPEGDAGEAAVRGALADRGGHAALLRAPEPLRATLPVFQPQAPALAALSRRVKEAFDPQAVLNPGRMYAEF
ncbi:glycolate oxidase subunit GlcE [Aquibaculum arenosum]|uniref:Glycolate oxidase subunit GlcE n=1 Tax=Aquibaculum arenosum TaxID=3032591 RepID=A0ABT5YJ44_9PROT|nr:glycolate oxidase subunit GlcE [Fodinicurvata sp. CAU 1616]MDF2094965.1 glycolate oxidase subunit GlcE [Fodinicurvata sp. CAU 1616]